MDGLRFRFFWGILAAAAGLVALCAVTAVSLFREQATVTGVLRENVSSRRAAADLRACLNTLIALETNHIESVADLHTRALTHLAEIREYANHPVEVDLSGRLDEGFARYLQLWQSLPPAGNPRHESAVSEATQFLETAVLFPCREIEGFNDRRVEETTAQHERVLTQLARGMAVVGVLGGVAGVVLGYGVARGLTRSIRRLQVQIRDAAGKLGPRNPEIVLTRDGDFLGLHEQVDQLAGRIENVVQELHQREREVLRAEQLAAVGQLAAGVAHEVRNPLTSIKMLVQLALEQGNSLPADDLRMMEGEIRRVEQSLRTFLEFARPQKAERRPVNLLDVVSTVLGLVRGRTEKQGVVLRVYDPGRPVVLTADPDQLRQVLVNLALNALDAMPTGGVLHLITREAPGRVEVEVADTGPGVAPDLMPRLFQPFVSGKDTGIGLGLVISRRIAEEHGGTLTAANRDGGGATFTLSLPTK